MTVDDDTLDAIEDELRGRTKDDAIHSGALADRVGIDDGEGNPKTREGIRILMEERGTPIASANCGYWLLENRQQLERYKEDLQGRIAGIQQRIETVEANYERAIADGGQLHVSDADIRHAIKDVVESTETAMRDDVVDDVSTRLDCQSTQVQEQLAEMEQNGFVYLLNDGGVRLP